VLTSTRNGCGIGFKPRAGGGGGGVRREPRPRISDSVEPCRGRITVTGRGMTSGPHQQSQRVHTVTDTRAPFVRC
jgi:hypothetical protein